ncbi:bifunctional DNA-formamidopyrimidine glycosylase/DNA-(apurinic or apyrimidinic site) lyase [Corynebacterium glyciniphilum]|uniref:bifunctional DNA-formamidopyrimidine glycosylase/DNA-(apurinic or apyrimidinic site) lyase n=1 Tax=Corynebacterium glyciniphilum TaxID=1404244 RepID=UPI0026539FDA|nr:bifunctional DNA-formamidopyrimidine glycosylase/DNA-(apurinic or apyrimidinic site) lyase [Corynebacterium glyciniphilum]MDN5682344.1 bifunctional DNA-formamidopyrimidine glycosylase/DNA-(apurinic or apyrimidinic site) lyase [Corynebacterium glyciniphilum]MDN6706468.1 bifunctional DNA-formamidopyrimidine glycosylase/DNA-(apurinic or apyrimidinic site) lyase [Corynebacterium glyciniphilum]
MPELPEVEVVRRGLAEHILGAEFEHTEVLHPRAVRGQDGGAAAVVAGLSGARVGGVCRRGKYLWLDLAGRGNLLVHLGMSGQMLLGEPGQVVSPHVRIRSRLMTAREEPLELTFVDQRTFGRWELTAADPVPHIALDPMDPAFDPVDTARSIRRRRSEIKRVLLDQTVVSGIGNIYADEALWAAGVHPRKRASAMRQQDVLRVLDAARQVMARALEAGGTSFDDLYVNVNGASGYFSRSLNAYGRTGEPCHRCGMPLQRLVIGGRSSHFCPRCQRKR